MTLNSSPHRDSDALKQPQFPKMMGMTLHISKVVKKIFALADQLLQIADMKKREAYGVSHELNFAIQHFDSTPQNFSMKRF